jgi:hypothetical protein
VIWTQNPSVLEAKTVYALDREDAVICVNFTVTHRQKVTHHTKALEEEGYVAQFL